jgi:tetratricopeptide (TPR) repeat protein
VLGLAVAVALRQLHRRPWLAFGVLWFFLHLLPTNSILPRLDPANDRHLYLALLGPAFLLAAVLWKVTGRRTASAVALAGVLLLATATIARNHDYRTEVSLWKATAATSASKARVWNNLGYAHGVEGNRAQAQAAYRRALELDPGHVKARYNLEALRETLP